MGLGHAEQHCTVCVQFVYTFTAVCTPLYNSLVQARPKAGLTFLISKLHHHHHRLKSRVNLEVI